MILSSSIAKGASAMFCDLSAKQHTYANNIYQTLITQCFTIQNKPFITSDKYLLQQIDTTNKGEFNTYNCFDRHKQ